MDLIADIGATNTRCALLDDRGHIVATEHFVNSEFADLGALLVTYLRRRRDSDQPREAALAIAAPVLGDAVRMININWSFSQTALREQLKVSRLLMHNDFEAIARGLPDLTHEDLDQIGAGLGTPRSTQAVLGPGSGLGVASLIPSADSWAVAGGEGGHVTMAAANDEEAQILKMVRDTVGHCSAERLLSGPGLVNLYWAVGQLHRVEVDKLQPEQVMAMATDGDPLAVAAREHFFAMLGTMAGNLALTMGARGGIYIAGGIVPDCIEQFRASKFRERFESKGRYRSYLEEIPTYVITRPEPAFVGLRRFLGYR
jgi:glucokinase